MNHAEYLLDQIRQCRRTGYGADLPSALDSQFIELAERYVQATEAERQFVRSHVHDDARLLLIGFSDRLATVAARTENKQLLFFALIAHSIEDFRHDHRENIVRLALINHVAEKIHEIPSELFKKAAQLSSDRGAKYMLEFIARPPAMKSLRTMKIVEEMTEDGVNYRYTK